MQIIGTPNDETGKIGIKGDYQFGEGDIMISDKHAICKFAYIGGEVDDWLPFAEDLIRKWSSQSSQEVRFESAFEIIIAAYLCCGRANIDHLCRLNFDQGLLLT